MSDTFRAQLIVVPILGAVITLFWILKNSKICSGGSFVQGCGRAILPWQAAISMPDGTSCCMECFKKEMLLYTSSFDRKEEGRMLAQQVCVDPSEVSTKIELMLEDGYELTNSYPSQEVPGKIVLEFKAPNKKGKVVLD